MILIDTTVWVDLFAAKQTPQVSQLESFIPEQKDLCTCGVVMTVVLQGIREDREFQRVQRILEELI